MRLLIIYLSCLFTPLASAQDVSQLHKQAQQAFQQGRFEQAVNFWKQAQTILSGANTPPASCQPLLKDACSVKSHSERTSETKSICDFVETPTPRSQTIQLLPSLRLEIQTGLASAYHSLGFYEESCTLLRDALCSATTDETHQALIRGQLGDFYLATQQYERAAPCLQQAWTQSQRLDSPLVKAQILLKQGNLSMLKHVPDIQDAIEKYQTSETLAKQADSQPLLTKILINLAHAYVSSESPELATVVTRLTTVLQEVLKLPPSHTKSFELLAIGQMANQVGGKISAEPPHTLRSIAFQALTEATDNAKSTNDSRALSYAYGQLGELYYQGRRFEEAERYTRQAIFYAHQTLLLEQNGPKRGQTNSWPELAYRWYWQMGRILKDQQKSTDAIGMYQQAIAQLSPVRQRIVDTGYHEPLTFEKEVAPLYYELLDLLLQRASQEADQKTLLDLLQALEYFKVDELEDYYKESCLRIQRSEIPGKIKELLDAQPPDTAILYPILLEQPTQRAGLLLSLPSNRLIFEPVFIAGQQPPANRIFTDAQLFRSELTNRDGKKYKDMLDTAKKLYQWLIQPVAKHLKSIHTLIVVPDGKLRLIPFTALHDGQQFVVEKEYSVLTTQAIAFLEKPTASEETPQILLSGVSESVRGFDRLGGVPDELKGIESLYTDHSYTLLDKNFKIPEFESQLSRSRFSIVHIATHGVFKGDPDDSFVLAYDGDLRMNKLQELLKKQQKTVDLLALSACETARGDDRAALGLAGVAVKAGVRSALATLWKVNDNSTAELSQSFYRHFQKEKLPKAKALQQAQLELLRGKFPHPYYWSPFLLIGNGK